MHSPRPIFLVLLWVALLAPPVAAAGIGDFLSAPKAEPWARWEVVDAESRVRVDHAAWGRFLERYVVASADAVNRVAYGSVTAEDRALLAGYLDALQKTAVGRLNRHEQFAYWVNFYNALTVRVILDHYPVATIRDIGISPGFFAVGPWDAKLVTVEGVELSLNDIEHRILRPIWRDPRVHYAVNCAAIGCPNLDARPYAAEGIEERLEAAASAYVNHPRGARLDGGKLVVSSIYAWYGEDFGGAAGVLRHLRAYAAPPLREALAGVAAIAGDDYDWSLNAAKAY